jgi:xylose isomerase
MKIIKIAAIVILSAFCIISCNKQEKFTNVLEIKISGIYGYWGGRGLYEYEINSNDSNRLSIHFTNGSEPKREDRQELYNKILSDNEMKDIYEFIKKFDLEREIELNNPAWAASHSFEGTLSINIDNTVYDKEIFMGQNTESDVYKILNYLNMFAPEGHDLPISGVNRIDIRIKE